MDTTIPSWLVLTDQQQQIAPPVTATSPAPYPATRTDLALMELTYENFFESALDRIALGHPIKDIIDDDPRQIPLVEYMRWVRKDKTRKERLKEAEQIAAELLVMQTVGIAEGINSMEDVQRSTLRVNNNWRIAQAYYPEKFSKTANSLPAGGGGAGGIVINIGTVESPYTVNEAPSTPVVEISDVEVKE